MTTDKRSVLITGAAGLVAGHLRHGWNGRYRLRLTDVKPVEDVGAEEDYRRLDITELEAFTDACVGMDVLVHLAADPSMQAEFYDTLLPLNIVGAYNAFEAARRAGCRRIVFASSIHAVLGYGPEQTISWDVPIYPQNVYGATKCWGEALARVYSDQHGLSCICVRLGGAAWTMTEDVDPQVPQIGITPGDQARLFSACIDADDDLDLAIVPGVSRHRRSWMNVEDAVRAVGYQPQEGTAFL